jgi:PAS domain S-box-containing protein
MSNINLSRDNIEPLANPINISEKKVTISTPPLSTFNNPLISNNNVRFDVKAESIIEENSGQQSYEKDQNLSLLKTMKMVFDKAPYANILTDANCKILEINSAALKMFGYTLEEITSIKSRCLFETTDDCFEYYLKERKAHGCINGESTGLTKDGKTFRCQLSSVNFVTEQGEERAISTIVDTSQSVSELNYSDTEKMQHPLEQLIKEKLKAEKLAAENNERIKHIFNASLEVLFDYNVVTGIISVSDGFEKEFGYKISDNMTFKDDWLSHIHPEDIDNVRAYFNTISASGETKWNIKYRFVSANGSVAEVVSKANIMRDEDGKPIRMIGSIQNLTKEKLLEETLRKKNNEKLRETFNSSPDVLWDLDVATDELIVNDAYKNLFGHTISGKFNLQDWVNYMHCDYKEAAQKQFNHFIESSESKWKFYYKYLRADGSVADVITHITVIRNDEGKPVRFMGTTHDVSKQKELEELLDSERKLKENQIAAAIIDAQEYERVELSKELHDNVNQLLGAAKLYNDMAQKNGLNREKLIKKSSEYTLSAIEEIRKISKGLVSSLIAEVGIVEAIKTLAEEIMEANTIHIICTAQDCCDNTMNDRFKLNIFRIVQEQINNVLKHAKASEIKIDLAQTETEFIISISDNGIGFDTDKRSKGIGISNIISRAERYKGSAHFISKPGNGCTLLVNFALSVIL